MSYISGLFHTSPSPMGGPRWLILSGCEVLGSNPGRVGFCLRGCAYTVLQAVPRLGVCSAVHGTVYNKEPLKSFEKSRAQSRLRAPFCSDTAMIVQKAT